MAKIREGQMVRNGRGELQIARELLATIGSEFFGAMVKHLAHALAADCVFIGEFGGHGVERATTLAAWTDGKADSFQYELAGSASAQIALGKPLLCRANAQKRFASDRVLARRQAQACVGIPLMDSDGHPVGMLMAIYRQPVATLRVQRSILEAFAPRAAAELGRKREEDRLRESEQRYRVFVALNEDAMWRVEFEQPISTDLSDEEQLERIFRYGYFAECNDALARDFGLEKADQLTGRRLGEFPLLANPAVRQAFLHNIRSRYRFMQVEATLDQDGKRRHLLRTQWGIVDNGVLQRIWGTTRDITRYKALEAQLHQAQKLESIGRLAAGVAHDFNNLLTVVMGYSGILLADRDPSDPAYAGLVQMRKAAERGAALTRQLLAFSRQQVWRPELLNLTALIADAEPMIRRLIGEDVRLVSNLDPSVALVRADSGQLHQAFLNLVVNARDAMPHGGTLTISTSNEEVSARDSTFAGSAPGEYVQLTVADTGTGITEEVRSHMFEPFYTTKEEGKGTGLGLSTVYGIVQQNGGHIAVETEPGQGTVFRIRLPAVAPESAPAKELDAEEAMPRGTETILLVEDQEEVREVYATILRSLGYNVIEAANPDKAQESALARNGKIDLLLTDVVMPGRTGDELADTLKASCAGMEVLFISGYGDLPRIQQNMSEGGFAYLQKPFAPVALANKVREILDQH
jgi:signal transduction histidine kinase/ActR/RegA family two-component response regulator